jgi:hypothetical protein
MVSFNAARLSGSLTASKALFMTSVIWFWLNSTMRESRFTIVFNIKKSP